MNTPIKQEVYLPVRDETKIDDETEYIAAEYYNGAYVEGIERKEGYFFTTEQLNQHISNVIKDALDTAYDEAKVVKDLGEDENGKLTFQVTECYYDENGYPIYVEKESITNTFDITFQKYRV